MAKNAIIDESGTVEPVVLQPANDDNQVKDGLTVQQQAEKLMGLNTTDGTTPNMAEGWAYRWVGVNPIERNTQTRAGVVICHKGDGFVINEDVFDVNDNGELERGDAVIGRIPAEVEKAYFQALADKSKAEIGGMGGASSMEELGKLPIKPPK